MRANRRFAICTAAVISISMVSSLSAAAADNTLSVDMTDNNNEAWADIAMANDDTVTTGVIVRTGSDQNSGVAGYLYRGDAVKVIDKGDTWTRISSGSVTGYVKNDYLTYGTDAKGLAEYYGTYGVKASWNDVNVFASNNSASKIVSEANDGDTFKYVSTDGHFIEVKDDNDNTVYVSDEDVDPVILLSTASSASEDDHSSAAASAPGTSADTASADASSNDDASGTESTDVPDENTSGTEGTDVSGEAESYTETTDASYDEGVPPTRIVPIQKARRLPTRKARIPPTRKARRLPTQKIRRPLLRITGILPTPVLLPPIIPLTVPVIQARRKQPMPLIRFI